MQRLRVCEEARSWVGTPYRQLGCVKGPQGAVDCSMLLVGCFVGAGILAPFDPRPYPPEWHLHRSEERYLAWMDLLARRTTTPQAGDVMVIRFGRCYSHAAIVMPEPDTVVHAYIRDGLCTYARGSEVVLDDRPHLFFDIWAALRERET